jgi:hypothetical protein
MPAQLPEVTRILSLSIGLSLAHPRRSCRPIANLICSCCELLHCQGVRGLSVILAQVSRFWILLVSLVLLTTQIANAQSPNIDLEAVAAACSGLKQATIKNESAKANYHNFELEVNTAGSLEIKESGQLLSKIDKFSAQDYNQCLIDVIKALREIPPSPGQQGLSNDMLDKLKVGNSLKYADSILGVPLKEYYFTQSGKGYGEWDSWDSHLYYEFQTNEANEIVDLWMQVYETQGFRIYLYSHDNSSISGIVIAALDSFDNLPPIELMGYWVGHYGDNGTDLGTDKPFGKARFGDVAQGESTCQMSSDESTKFLWLELQCGGDTTWEPYRVIIGYTDYFSQPSLDYSLSFLDIRQKQDLKALSGMIFNYFGIYRPF